MFEEGGGGAGTAEDGGFPTPVEPLPNARVVNFPWQQARTAVTALKEAESLLRRQLEQRVGMEDSISDWQGSFRDEFDEKYASLLDGAAGMWGFDGLVGRFARTASSIISGAEEANFRQSGYNAEAEAAQAGLTMA